MPGKRIGILGGTFDPTHNGHLRFAVELRDAIVDNGRDSCVHLIPCHIPPHRGSPLAMPQQRLEMLQLAVGNRSGLHIDTRELESDSNSYSFDTLMSLREEYPDAQLILAVGVDAFSGFCSWHRWQEILDCASIIVTTRPGTEVGSESAQALLSQRCVSLDTLNEPGQIAQLEMTPLAISSSLIRALIASRQSLDFLLPDAVINYIEQHNLYRL